ncbi:MAG: PCMD domain-containing protein [Chitinophagales bacterium]|nr:PCMD domain-containing protein [Chitinophagales bacterium]MDW8428469.1 hypothetical protein [Chitinophagales bacterium]
MKGLKIFGTAILGIWTAAGAQTVVPNAGMEEWNNLVVYEEPKSWATPNALVAALGLKVVEKSTDAVGGQYAAKLTSAFLPTFNVTVPGAMSTGTLDVSNPNNPTFRGGFKLNSPDAVAVIGHYKYLPVGNDSCMIYAIKTRWNIAAAKRDTVAVSYFTSGAKTSYTFFVAPFVVLMPGVTADSANIIVSSSADVTSAQPGSVLFLDNIDFTNNVGIADLSSDIRLPALITHQQPACITIPEAFRSGLLQVISTTGQLILQQELDPQHSTVTVEALKPGFYFVLLKDAMEGRAVVMRWISY